MLHIKNNKISFENNVNAYEFILNKKTKTKLLCTVPSCANPFLCVSKLMMVTFVTPHKSKLIYIFEEFPYFSSVLRQAFVRLLCNAN